MKIESVAIRLILVSTVAVALLLAGCKGAVGIRGEKGEQGAPGPQGPPGEPPPEADLEAIAQKLKGTWRATIPWHDDRGNPDVGIATLTFTDSRFISNIRWNETRRPELDWGTWSVLDDSRILRTIYDCCHVRTDRSSIKYFSFINDNELRMQDWRFSTSGAFLAFERVTDSFSLEGTWKADERWEYIDVDNEHIAVHRITTITVGDKLHFQQNTEVHNLTTMDVRNTTEEVAGSWDHDPSELFVHVVVESVSSTRDRGLWWQPDSFWLGKTLRFAYGHGDNSDETVWSTFYDEQRWTNDNDELTDASGYGWYGLPLTRQ